MLCRIMLKFINIIILFLISLFVKVERREKDDLEQILGVRKLPQKFIL